MVEFASGRHVDADREIERLTQAGGVRTFQADRERPLLPFDVEAVPSQKLPPAVVSAYFDAVSLLRQVDGLNEGWSYGRSYRLAVAQEDDFGDAGAGGGPGGERGTEYPAVRRQKLDSRQLVQHDRLAAGQQVKIGHLRRRGKRWHLDRAAGAQQPAPQVVFGAEFEAVGPGRQTTVEVERDARCRAVAARRVDRNAAAYVVGDDKGVGEPVAEEDIAGDRHPVEDLAGAEFGEMFVG